MLELVGDQHDDLLRKHNSLVDGIRMIRRAMDKASRAGLLPYQPIGVTPLEECEAIARSIYAGAAKRQESAISVESSPKDLTHRNGLGGQLNQLGGVHD
jgi:hypothetical protein